MIMIELVVSGGGARDGKEEQRRAEVDGSTPATRCSDDGRRLNGRRKTGARAGLLG